MTKMKMKKKTKTRLRRNGRSSRGSTFTFTSSDTGCSASRMNSSAPRRESAPVLRAIKSQRSRWRRWACLASFAARKSIAGPLLHKRRRQNVGRIFNPSSPVNGLRPRFASSSPFDDGLQIRPTFAPSLLRAALALLVALAWVAVVDQARAEERETAALPLPQALEKIRAKHELPALAAAAIRGGRSAESAAVGLRPLGGTEAVTLDHRGPIGPDTQRLT